MTRLAALHSSLPSFDRLHPPPPLASHPPRLCRFCLTFTAPRGGGAATRANTHQVVQMSHLKGCIYIDVKSRRSSRDRAAAIINRGCV